MEKTFKYCGSGQPILPGDVVKIGEWNAVVTGVVQEGAPGWDDCGGVSLDGPTFGSMRLERINEDLVLISRKTEGTK